jgi:hypothetical protein
MSRLRGESQRGNGNEALPSVFRSRPRAHPDGETDGSNHDFYVKPDAALVLAGAISRAALRARRPGDRIENGASSSRQLISVVGYVSIDDRAMNEIAKQALQLRVSYVAPTHILRTTPWSETLCRRKQPNITGRQQNISPMPPATTGRRPNITRPEVTRRQHTMLIRRGPILFTAEDMLKRQ